MAKWPSRCALSRETTQMSATRTDCDTQARGEPRLRCASRLATARLPLFVAALAFVLGACSGGGGSSGATTTQPTPPGGNNSVNVLTWHYDNSRSGVNSNETGLTPTNV